MWRRDTCTIAGPTNVAGPLGTARGQGRLEDLDGVNRFDMSELTSGYRIL